MSLQLNGSGTITGLAEGGIEDAKIINADIKDDTIEESKLNIHAAPSGTDKYLAYTSNGMEWATVSGGAALTGSTDNTVCTVTGANAIQGEAALTFDGTTLGINNPTPKFTLTDSDTTGPPVCLVDGSGGDLDLEADINNAKNDSKVRVIIDGSEKVRFQTAGGISFNGDTGAAQALDDYDEGTFTATCDNSVTLTQNTLSYTRVGRMVHVCGLISVNSDNSSSHFTINNLPFAAGGGYADLSTPAVRLNNWDLSSDCKFVAGYTDSNKVYFMQCRDNATVINLEADSGADMIINLTYFVA